MISADAALEVVGDDVQTGDPLVHDWSAMSARPPRNHAEPVAVVVTAEEANAIVYAIASLAVAEGEYLDPMPVSSRSPDLIAISLRCARIARLAAINDQLGWVADRRAGDDPSVITASDDVLRELAGALEATAQERARFPDDELEPFAFDKAAKAIRATIGIAAVPEPDPDPDPAASSGGASAAVTQQPEPDSEPD